MKLLYYLPAFGGPNLYYKMRILHYNIHYIFNQTKKFFKDRVKGRLISRGNAISSESFESAIKNGKFCRVWTPNNPYKYQNAIRKSGLFSSDSKSKPGFSVTSDNLD